MTQDNLISRLLSYPGVYEDHPFDTIPHAAGGWTAIRHRQNRRCFAFLFKRGGHLCLNLKCDPMRSDFLRKAYPGVVTPAYHMNKEHWNTIWADAHLPEEELDFLIEHSYQLTAPKKGRIL